MKCKLRMLQNDNDIFDFRGNITFNSSYPDGTPRKKLDLTFR